MKESVLKGVLALIIAGATVYFRNLAAPIIVLMIVMIIDYITGVMCAITDKKLSSSVGFKGICRKVLIFTLVGIGNIVDVYVLGQGGVLRTAVIFFYLSNEGVSMLENCAHIGLPVPDKLRDVLAQLHERAPSCFIVYIWFLDHDPFCVDHSWLVRGCYWRFQKTECMV